MARYYHVIRVPVRSGLSGLGAAALSPAQLYQVAIGAGFPPDSATTAVAIALQESSGNPSAFNGAGCDNSYGLWQINMIENKPGCDSLGASRRAALGLSSNDQLFDPATNARAAYMIWGGSDSRFSNWTMYKNGRYLASLPAAQSAAAAVDAAVQVAGPDAPIVASFDPLAALAGVDPVLLALGAGLAVAALLVLL